MANFDESQLDQPLGEADITRLQGPGIWDTIMDVVHSSASGMEKNVSSYPGTGGDLYDLLADLGIVANRAAGATPEQTQALRKEYEAAPANALPTTEDVHNYLTRNPYTPKTGPGRVAETVTSLVGPRGVTKGLEHFGRNVVAPFISSEAAQWIAEKLGLGPEETELLTAASSVTAGPVLEQGKRTAIKTLQGPRETEPATTMQDFQGADVPLTPETPNARAERLRRLRGEGVEMSGGQALGNEFVKRLEVGPFSTRGGTLNEQQGRQLTRAALQRVGINADIASPEVMSAAQQQFSRDYETMIQQNNGLPFDGTTQNQLQDIGARFEDLAGTAKGTPVEKFFNRIIDAAHQYGGTVIPPDVFQQINSELGTAIQATGKAPQLAPMNAALREMRDTLYDSIGRNGQPQVQEQARNLNNRYRNFKIIQKSVGGAGEGVSYGIVSPEKLRAELERRDPTGYTQGRGDLNQLARDAQSLTAMPMSGTGAQNVTSSLTGLGHAAMVAPISRLISTPSVKTAIVNRATGTNPAYFDPLQMPPVIGMAADTPDLPYPGMPVPVEEEEAPPTAAPVQVAPPIEQPVPVEPVEPVMRPPPGQQGALEQPDQAAQLASLLQGLRLPMRV